MADNANYNVGLVALAMSPSIPKKLCGGLFCHPFSSTFLISIFTVSVFLLSLSINSYAIEITQDEVGNQLIVNDAAEMQVVTVSKNVEIRGKAREVFVLGGDVEINGAVSGDVGVIGGNIHQKTGGYIGGDVIVIGGKYKTDDLAPLRQPDKQTTVINIFEDEIRETVTNPKSLLWPSYTPKALAAKAISMIFWFLVTLGIATIAPGAMSRAVYVLRSNKYRVLSLGIAGLSLLFIIAILASLVLPDSFGAVVWLLIFFLLFLVYIFGRATLHLYLGKLLSNRFSSFADSNDAATAAIGILAMTVILSVPVAWLIALFAAFAVGFGTAVKLGSTTR
ncbi:MAG TPA: hypothetical protein VNK26_03940 [Pyrinomonadaceae bacterium]|nr:hypothetical protein [Pyrinomonadaceae bacterium]